MNTTLPRDEAAHVTTVVAAAQALLDAFGGNTPDWLAGEAAALDGAVTGYWAKREAVTAVEPAPVRLSIVAGLRDMIDGGRLTEAMIPDDYAWLLEQLEALETYPLNSALEAH